MLYANYAREKLHNLTLVKEARGYPCVLLKSKGKNLKDYEIYGNSVQNGTPTPDNPIEIESVGEKTKNLLNPKAQLTTLINVYKGIDVIEYANQNVMLSIRLKEGKGVPSGIYFGVSYKLTTSGAFGYWLIDNGVLKNTRFNLKQLGDTVTNMGIGVYPATQTNWDKIFDAFDVQLELGTIVTDYEPYGYKIPVTIRGKNLIDIPDIDSSTVDTTIKCNLTKNFTVSCQEYPTAIKNDNGVETSIWRFQLKYLDGTLKYVVDNALKGIAGSINTYKATEENPVIEIKYRSICIREGAYKGIQIEYGSATNYEPYVEPKTTNIYLNEPLRKIGDYADYIDFKNKKIVRYVKSITFDGINNKATYISLYSNGLYYGVFSIENGVNGSYDVSKNTHFKSRLGVYIGNSYVTAYGKLYVMVHTNQELNNVALWNGWLEEQYNVGLPVRACYGLATPTEETLDLPNIPTHKGTTVIETDTNISPSDIWVKYISK